ncbi:MAG: hypothetical protein AAF721_18920 [Myxococcota bacterium]
MGRIDRRHALFFGGCGIPALQPRDFGLVQRVAMVPRTAVILALAAAWVGAGCDPSTVGPGLDPQGSGGVGTGGTTDGVADDGPLDGQGGSRDGGPATGADANPEPGDESDSGTRGGADEGSDGVGDGTGDDAGDDSGDDSGATSTGSGMEPGPCPPYSGLGGVGSSWDTATTAAYEAANGLSQEAHREVTAVSPGPTTTITVVTTTTAQGDQYSATTVTTSTYLCDADGAWLSEFESESVGVSGGTPFDVASVSTYAPAWFSLPWDVEVGTTWMASSTVTTTTVNGPVQNMSSQAYEVIGTDSVQTPAGSFDVLRFAWSGGGAAGEWLGHDEAGGIAATDGAYELLAFEIVPF